MPLTNRFAVPPEAATSEHNRAEGESLQRSISGLETERGGVVFAELYPQVLGDLATRSGCSAWGLADVVRPVSIRHRR